MAIARSLTSRPLDLFYFIYFLTHIPASFLIDFQAIAPRAFIPTFLRSLVESYVELSNDPMIAGATGLKKVEGLTWFVTFIYLELFFQVPVFILGMRGLWKDSRGIYILLLIYGASTATTTLPCLSTILMTPITTPEMLASGTHSITHKQLAILLASYIPYVIIPVLMTLDMAARVGKLAKAGDEKKAR